MAHLAIVGSHSTNGVAAIHSELLKQTVVPDFAALFPERFNNKTNGVTQRRFLLLANPPLAKVITDAIGDGWIADLDQLEKLKPLADDKAFRAAIRKAKREAKVRFAGWLKSATGQVVDPETIFDTQIKRIHEYKRQLLNALHIVVLYNRLRENPKLDVPPRTFFFAGKAAPAYHFAKLVIKFINNLGATIDGDPAMKGRLKVVFVPDYSVSVAERLIPASDVSEQISTAGYEASGTEQHEVHDERRAHHRHARRRDHRDGRRGGRGELLPLRPERRRGRAAAAACTTRSGITTTIPRRAPRSTSSPATTSAGTSRACSRRSSTRCCARATTTCTWPTSRATAKRTRGWASCTRTRRTWSRKAILNIAASGTFSSDRTIAEYARDIWHAEPCPVE